MAVSPPFGGQHAGTRTVLLPSLGDQHVEMMGIIPSPQLEDRRVEMRTMLAPLPVDRHDGKRIVPPLLFVDQQGDLKMVIAELRMAQRRS